MDNAHRQQSVTRRFLVYHLPFIGYGVIVIIASIIPKLPTPPIGFHGLDKLAHFVEFGLFAFLAFRSFSQMSHRITANRAVLISALFLSFYAALTEVVQQYVPGRSSDLYDLIMDVLGALVVLAYLRLRRRRLPATSP
jgi:VanZ family protein